MRFLLLCGALVAAINAVSLSATIEHEYSFRSAAIPLDPKLVRKDTVALRHSLHPTPMRPLGSHSPEAANDPMSEDHIVLAKVTQYEMKLAIDFDSDHSWLYGYRMLKDLEQHKSMRRFKHTAWGVPKLSPSSNFVNPKVLTKPQDGEYDLTDPTKLVKSSKKRWQIHLVTDSKFRVFEASGEEFLHSEGGEDVISITDAHRESEVCAAIQDLRLADKVPPTIIESRMYDGGIGLGPRSIFVATVKRATPERQERPTAVVTFNGIAELSDKVPVSINVDLDTSYFDDKSICDLTKLTTIDAIPSERGWHTMIKRVIIEGERGTSHINVDFVAKIDFRRWMTRIPLEIARKYYSKIESRNKNSGFGFTYHAQRAGLPSITFETFDGKYIKMDAEQVDSVGHLPGMLENYRRGAIQNTDSQYEDATIGVSALYKYCTVLKPSAEKPRISFTRRLDFP